MRWFGCVISIKSILAYLLIFPALHSYGQIITFDDPDIITPIDLVPFVDSLIIEDAVGSSPRLDENDPFVRLIDFDDLPIVSSFTPIGDSLPNSGLKNLSSVNYLSCDFASFCRNSFEGFSPPNVIQAREPIQFDKDTEIGGGQRIGQISQFSIAFRSLRSDAVSVNTITLQVRLDSGEILIFPFQTRESPTNIAISKRITVAFQQDLRVDTISIIPASGNVTQFFDDIQFKFEITRNISWKPQGEIVLQQVVNKDFNGSIVRDVIQAERQDDKKFKLKKVGEDNIVEILSNRFRFYSDSLEAIGVVEGCQNGENIIQFKATVKTSSGTLSEQFLNGDLCSPLILGGVELPIEVIEGGFNVIVEADSDDRIIGEENEFDNIIALSVDKAGAGFDLSWNKNNIFVNQTFELEDGQEFTETVGRGSDGTISLKIPGNSANGQKIVNVLDQNVLVGNQAFVLIDPFAECEENTDRPIFYSIKGFDGQINVEPEVSACFQGFFNVNLPDFDLGETKKIEFIIDSKNMINEIEEENNKFSLSLKKRVFDIGIERLRVGQVVFPEDQQLEDLNFTHELVSGKKAVIGIQLKSEQDLNQEVGQIIARAIFNNTQKEIIKIVDISDFNFLDNSISTSNEFYIEFEPEDIANDTIDIQIDFIDFVDSNFVNNSTIGFGGLINPIQYSSQNVIFKLGMVRFTCEESCYGIASDLYLDKIENERNKIIDRLPVGPDNFTLERDPIILSKGSSNKDEFKLVGDSRITEGMNEDLRQLGVYRLKKSGMHKVIGIVPKEYEVYHEINLNPQEPKWVGYAFTKEGFPERDFDYNSILIEDGADILTIVHEIGHVAGLRHLPEGDPATLSVDAYIESENKVLSKSLNVEEPKFLTNIMTSAFKLNPDIFEYWFDSKDFSILRDAFFRPNPDPEIFVISIEIDKNTGPKIKEVLFFDEGNLSNLPTGGGDLEIDIMNSNSESLLTIIGNPSFSVFIETTEGEDIITLDRTFVNIAIPRNDEISEINVSFNEIEEKIDVRGMLLKSAIDRVDTSLIRNPAQNRLNVLAKKVDQYKESLDAGQVSAAKAHLGELKKKVENWIDDRQPSSELIFGKLDILDTIEVLEQMIEN